MSIPRVIVCERTGIWATVLARQLPRDVRLMQVRGLRECAAQLSDAPTSLLAVELSPTGVADVLDFVSRLPARFPQARVVVLADHGLQACEQPLREAGAVHFVASPRELGGLERTISNHFAGLATTHNDFAESVWDRLPWSDAATTKGR